MYPDNYNRESSRKTPWVVLGPGKIFILGRSIPENPGDFYRPVYDWICEYKQNYSGKTKVGLGFEYINTSSIKWIFNILKEVAEIKDISMNMRVTWYYEQGDEDMSELGFMLRSLVDCPFVVIEVDSMDRSRYEEFLSGF